MVNIYHGESTKIINNDVKLHKCEKSAIQKLYRL